MQVQTQGRDLIAKLADLTVPGYVGPKCRANQVLNGEHLLDRLNAFRRAVRYDNLALVDIVGQLPDVTEDPAFRASLRRDGSVWALKRTLIGGDNCIVGLVRAPDDSMIYSRQVLIYCRGFVDVELEQRFIADLHRAIPAGIPAIAGASEVRQVRDASWRADHP